MRVLCLWVGLFVYACVHVFNCVSVRLCVCEFLYMSWHVFSYVHLSMCTCVYICKYVWVVKTFYLYEYISNYPENSPSDSKENLISIWFCQYQWERTSNFYWSSPPYKFKLINAESIFIFGKRVHPFRSLSTFIDQAWNHSTVTDIDPVSVKKVVHFLIFLLRFLNSEVVIYLAFCLDLAQGHMKGIPNETRTHSCRFASRDCLPLHHQRRLKLGSEEKNLLDTFIWNWIKEVRSIVFPSKNTFNLFDFVLGKVRTFLFENTIHHCIRTIQYNTSKSNIYDTIRSSAPGCT